MKKCSKSIVQVVAPAHENCSVFAVIKQQSNTKFCFKLGEHNYRTRERP